jgi:hypothetical protein
MCTGSIHDRGGGFSGDVQARRGMGAGDVAVAPGRLLRADLGERRKRTFEDQDSGDSSPQQSKKKPKRTATGTRWISGPMPAAVAVSLLRTSCVYIGRTQAAAHQADPLDATFLLKQVGAAAV